MSSLESAGSVLAHHPQPAQLASLPKVRDVQISPDGSMILYQVQPFYKAPGRALSELWIAQTNIPHSARRLMDRVFNDRAGVFHPDSRRVIFLSDRHDPGRPAIIHILDLDATENSDSDPVAVCIDFRKEGVQAFELSPDGKMIAFTSKDPTSEEEARKVQQKDDAIVFSAHGAEPVDRYPRLRIHNFSTGETWTPEGLRKDRYIEAFTWSPNSTHVLYRLRQGRGSEFTEREVTLESISIEGSAVPRILGVYPRSPSGQNIWTHSEHIISLQSYEAGNILDARTIFAHRHSMDRSFTPSEGAQRLYGLKEDAVRIVNARANSREDITAVAVEICSDTDTHIDIITVDPSTRDMKTLLTVFQTEQEAVWFGAWDAKTIVDEAGRISYIFAAVLSSGVRHEPPNVWTRRVSHDGHEVSPKLRLSSHLQYLAEAPVFTTEVIQWEAVDGTVLSGLIRYPPGYSTGGGPRPTVLFIHGGPYRMESWSVSVRYASSVATAHLSVPEGGSLTAWGVTKTKTRFKAAIVGAGVANWEGMIMESGSPELEEKSGISPGFV
ncbi:hypothetical protein H0H81_004087 [Sphagnurus paluster]|uniref:Dipeptidyl-peptidase V n=1 Tax=Sphagnurus paluster TaxID=117069 RepID=A0A9P7KER1_9AGAR|nr:hypothetical protein H0H81_004087 [Sphagnurus paluster]